MQVATTNGNAKAIAKETLADKDELIKLLQAELAKKEAELAAKSTVHNIGVKVTEKGGISVYGMGRFPVTLYASQWMALTKNLGLVMNAIAKNFDKLAYKDDSQKAAVKAWIEAE